MADKEIDPSDIGKFPELIKTAQKEMATNDVFVCGECHSSFNFIQEFQTHKESKKCPKESTLKDCKDPKPKTWAFLLWKASHLNNSENRKPNFPPWTLYQKWTKLDESVRETWIVAGKTIQSFVKMGQGTLQEMPVKITKTVVDSVTKNQENQKTPPTLPLRGGARQTISKPLAEKSENEGVRKAQAVSRPAVLENKSPAASSAAPKTKLAKRTMSDQTITEHDVEKILAKRFNPRRKIHEYLVKWDGVPHDQNSWEPFTHLGTVKHLVDVFEVQLAKQKEQRNQAAAAAAAAAVKPNLPPPAAIRPERNAKINALDQVSKWLTDEDGIGAKRKNSDDSDFHDSEEDEMSELDMSSPKKPKMDLSSSSSIISDKGAAKARVIQKPVEKKAQENAAEVVLTKSKSTGVVRKTNTNSPSQAATGETTLNEAQIRIVQKGEAVPTGVVRIIPTTSPKRPVAPPKTGSAGPKVVTATSKATTNLMKSLPSSTTVRHVQKPGASVSPRVVTTAKSPQGQAVVKKTVPTRPTSSAQPATTTVGRTLVSRVVKPTAGQPASASEQKIMSLSRQGSLRVTKRVTKESDDEDGIEDLFKSMDAAPPAAPVEEEEELPMTLCPLTGQVLGQAEGEPVKEAEEADAADPAEVQQLLTNEDGTPLIVTGEDGTIYQVAGKNANGQTVLIAQGGAEGEQPVVLLANDGDDETGLQFGTGEDGSQITQQVAVGETETGEEGAAEAASGEEGQVVHTEGGQQLTIQTEDEGQITAEIVQAELPSPGGTRRVVLLLPDGSLMMTEVNEEQYQSLNLNT